MNPKVSVRCSQLTMTILEKCIDSSMWQTIATQSSDVSIQDHQALKLVRFFAGDLLASVDALRDHVCRIAGLCWTIMTFMSF